MNEEEIENRILVCEMKEDYKVNSEKFNKITSTFEIHDEMYNDEFEYRKKEAEIDVIQRYINGIKGNDTLFNKKIAFELHEKRYAIGERMFEEIELAPIFINIIEHKVELNPYQTYKKYSFKERLKILFTGRCL